MRVLVFLNSLSLGGTEKAACRWAVGLKARNHELTVVSIQGGPREETIKKAGIPLFFANTAPMVATIIADLRPDIIHAHVPGFEHRGDLLGDALRLVGTRIPVVQTNVFGRLENPKEDEWTSFRLFISWTSCVQAARRSFRILNEQFFAANSVAVYPLDPVDAPPAHECQAFRRSFGVLDNEVLFGRFSRPEPNKWSNLALDAFRLASKQDPSIKLLLREPPAEIAKAIMRSADADRFLILPSTFDQNELHLTLASVDAVLHTSLIGESFGYGIAEPMNLGKPVITHSVPWQDQAQIELVRHREAGFIASTPAQMAMAIQILSNNKQERNRMGQLAKAHIRRLSNPEESVRRMERIFTAVLEGQKNPYLQEDLQRAEEAAEYLDRHEFGHSAAEALCLMPLYYRVRFSHWRKWLIGTVLARIRGHKRGT